MTNSIIWFRQDLRVADNPALAQAAKAKNCYPIFIDDPRVERGAASKLWLHHSLHALSQKLDGALALYHGKAEEVLPRLIAALDIDELHYNYVHTPAQRAIDKTVDKIGETMLTCRITGHEAQLLWSPDRLLKKDNTPYRVFTPFYKAAQMIAPHPPLPAPEFHPQKAPQGLSLNNLGLDALNLCPTHEWGQALIAHWQVGEDAARRRFQAFLAEGLGGYKQGRDYPSLPHVSRLSPHLHFGEISPQQIWRAVYDDNADPDHAHFCSELGWREFSYHLLHHFPELPSENLQKKFDRFAWADDPHALSCWQKGQTGYPIVDAAMRQLWQTGYMHNRLRMVVGSFLVKNLLIDWRHGADWFWDCLVDADLANNSAGWQWIAGCGADAAPYFRIFNPITQGEKFDPQGHFTRAYLPELETLPDRYLFHPWDAPKDILQAANIELGVDYPLPIVDIKASRARALHAFSLTKGE